MTAAARTTWSQPYLYVTAPDATRTRVPLPADGDATTLSGLELAPDATLVVRWRVPGQPNAFRRTFGPGRHDAAGALLAGLLRAQREPGQWRPRPDGIPEPAPAVRRSPAPPAPPAPMSPQMNLEMLGVYDASGRALVSPDNAVLGEIAAGRRQLGSTVSDVIDRLIAKRQHGWGAKQDTNVRNQLEFVRQVLVYSEPDEHDLPEVAAWKRARLDLDGVNEGDSLHLALLLAPDLEDGLQARRTTDRRIDLWNLQAQRRLEKQWEVYTDAVAARKAGTRRGGRMPARPADRAPLRAAKPMGARTEQLFLQLVHAVCDYADRFGLFSATNPWKVFAADGSKRRRPATVRVHERNVPPIGPVVQIAEKVACLGRIDPRTHLPIGDRFKAVVLTAVATQARPTELWALGPRSYEPGAFPCIVFTGSAGPANTASTLDGSSWEERSTLKGRDAGVIRRVPIPRFVADTLDEHIAKGYASADHLFTGPEGGPVRWSSYTDTYWKPAVAAVLGSSDDPVLREMPLRWLRKAGITWLLRAGMDVVDVAERSGHDPAVLWSHYAGVVHGGKVRPHTRHDWHDIDAAWQWAATEMDIA